MLSEVFITSIIDPPLGGSIRVAYNTRMTGSDCAVLCNWINTHTHTRGRTHDGNGNGSGDGNKSSSGDGNGDEDGNGDGNANGIGEGGREAKKHNKSHNICRHHVRNGRLGWKGEKM